MHTKLNQCNDAELCRILQKKGPDADSAFLEIYNRYASRIHAYCFRILNNADQAKDVFQETFIKFYNVSATLEPLNNIFPYLLTIARNLTLNVKRDHKDNIPVEEALLIDERTNSYEQDELLRLIKFAVELLDPSYREVFVLREYDGLGLDEIARITGASAVNVKMRLYRARQQVKELLADYIKDLEH